MKRGEHKERDLNNSGGKEVATGGGGGGGRDAMMRVKERKGGYK